MPKKAFLNLPPETREEILQKTVKLYTEHPFEKITLQMILDELKLHPTTFYRYFEDKDELYFYTQLQMMDRLEEHQRGVTSDYEVDIFTWYEDAPEVLSEQEKQFVESWYSLPRDVMLRGYMDVFKDGLFKRYRTALRRFRAEGRLYDDVDEDLISYMYATTMFNLLLFCREFGIEDREVLSNMKKNFYMKFFRRGLLKDPEGKEES